MKITNRQIFKTAAIAGSVIIPAVHITKVHTDFYKGQSKKKADMRNRMIGFFAGLTPGLIMIHRFARKNLKKTSNFVWGLVGAGLSAIGAKVGVKLAKLYNQQILWKQSTKPETFVSYNKTKYKKGLYKDF